jgi:hypothetical protein
MRALNVLEIEAVSGGALDTVDVVASRLKDGWQLLSGAALRAFIEKAEMADLLKRAGYLGAIIEVADYLGIDDWLLQLSREINAREDKAQYDESKLRK